MKKIYLENLPKNYNKEDLIKKYILNGVLDIEFIYKSDFILTKHLRDFVEIILQYFGAPNKMISRIILISDELNNNAIEYGSNSMGLNKFRISIQKNYNKIKLKIEVEDNGDGKHPKKSFEMEKIRETKVKNGYSNYRSIRGRGLFLIITQIVDELYFKDSEKGGLIVGINKEFSL